MLTWCLVFGALCLAIGLYLGYSFALRVIAWAIDHPELPQVQAVFRKYGWALKLERVR